MYLTNNEALNFDWDNYFQNIGNEEYVPTIDYKQFFVNSRKLLGENNQLMSFSMCKLLRNLMKEVSVKSPQIIELGAGTGFLSRCMLTMYGGTSLMVDKCESSYHSFMETMQNNKNLSSHISYLIEDIFKLELTERFDIVCSFGVIEHFQDKKEILQAHKKFLKEDGYIIVIVPIDSKLTRLYYDAFVELNLGYRELLTKAELYDQIRASGLSPIKSEISTDYVYDYLAVLCR